MQEAERITVVEAASIKGVSRQRVHMAIQEGHINGDWFGAQRAVIVDTVFDA